MQTAQTKPCRRCNGTGGIDFYAHVLNGVCFRCKGTGDNPTVEQTKARRIATTKRAIEVAHADIAYSTTQLDRNKAEASKRADRMVAKGDATDRAAAFQAMIDDGAHNVRRVQLSRRAVAAHRDQLATAEAKLAKLTRGTR